jgi:hypothetical protein
VSLPIFDGGGQALVEDLDDAVDRGRREVGTVDVAELGHPAAQRSAIEPGERHRAEAG